MEISPVWTDGIAVMTLKTKCLDARARQGLRTLFARVAAAGVRQLVLDFHEVRGVDSAGCAAVLYFLRQCQRAHCACIIGAPLGRVRTVFELIGLHRVVEVVNSVEEAVRAFRVSSPAEELELPPVLTASSAQAVEERPVPALAT